MKLLTLLPLLAVALAACGARTTMETCALGAEDCACLSGACNPGLACVADFCVRPGVVVAGTGGQAGSGGTVGSGGIVGSGGTRVASGGIVGSGGITVGVGGRVGTGGIAGMGSGGRAGAGGSTAIVTFMAGRATGAMDGWGWVALGRKDSLSSPTCLGQPITADSPCTTTTTWSSNVGLCITGVVPALPASPRDSDYADNWGIMVAAECHDPPSPLGGSYRAINIQTSGLPTTNLRAVVHRMGDQEDVNYCATMSPNTPINFAAFNTHCWDGTGDSLLAPDVPNLDWIGIQVISSSTATKVNLCLDAVFLIP